VRAFKVPHHKTKCQKSGVAPRNLLTYIGALPVLPLIKLVLGPVPHRFRRLCCMSADLLENMESYCLHIVPIGTQAMDVQQQYKQVRVNCVR
jgi:hypothetical protein